jgi:hypothetical protein
LIKKLHYTLITLLLISAESFSQDFQYHIYERYYNHHDNLRPSAYAVHSHLQGPAFEEAINRNLKSGVIKCASGIESKYIFSLEPKIFYNYVMNILYGELKVKIYGPENVLKSTQTISSKHQGKIYLQTSFYIDKIYDQLSIKLKNEVLDKLPINNSSINGNFCTTIELSKPKKIIDKDYKNPIQA